MRKWTRPRYSKSYFKGRVYLPGSGLVALLLMQSSRLQEHRVADIFKPLATPAESEKSIALLTLAITAGIFIVVAGTYRLHDLAISQEARR